MAIKDGRMRIPNFFNVGAPKSGTTSLYHYMKAHPEIYMSPIKEPHHFSMDFKVDSFQETFRTRVAFDAKSYFGKYKKADRDIAYIPDRKEYLRLYEDAGNERYLGEMSTAYLYSSEAAGEIYKASPAAKIIMILRQPIRRAFSHFLMDLREGDTSEVNFLTALRTDFERKDKGWGRSHLYVELGLYAEQVKRYQDYFPTENLKVILFDDYANDNEAVVRDIFRFLDIDDTVPLDTGSFHNSAYQPINFTLYNFFKDVRNAMAIDKILPKSISKGIKRLMSTKNGLKLDKGMFKAALEYFYDDITQLSQRIRRDLTSWTIWDRIFDNSEPPAPPP